MILQTAFRYLKYLYETTDMLCQKHKRCHRDLKKISIKIPPETSEISYVFNHQVDMKEIKCDAKDVQEFFKNLKELLLILQTD